MAKRKSELDRAIESIEAEIKTLQIAMSKLLQQKAAAPARKKKDKVDAPQAQPLAVAK